MRGVSAGAGVRRAGEGRGGEWLCADRGCYCDEGACEQGDVGARDVMPAATVYGCGVCGVRARGACEGVGGAEWGVGGGADGLRGGLWVSRIVCLLVGGVVAESGGQARGVG